MLPTLVGLWETLQQVEPDAQVRNRFQVSRALDGTLAGLIPILNGPLAEPCFRIGPCT